MQALTFIVNHKAELLEAVFAMGGVFGAVCALFQHAPFVSVAWQERFARGAVWASKAFSVNKRPDSPEPGNPIAPKGE
jgi:hypothetical protein